MLTTRTTPIACLGLAYASSLQAGMLIDEFNDGTLDPAWQVSFVEDAGGWTFEETGGQLVVTDIVDNVGFPDSQVWARVRLDRDLDAPITGDFVLQTQFSWQASGANALQSLVVGLYDDEGNNIANAWHYDAWQSWNGGTYASTQDGDSFSGNNTAPLSGTHLVTITREGEDIKIQYANGFMHEGTSDEAVHGVYLRFDHYRIDPNGSTFGTESVDYIRLIPEPSSLALLAVGGLLASRRRRQA